jgi:hypothetical protein
VSRAHRSILVLLTVAAVAMIGWRAFAWQAAAAEFDRDFAFHSEIASKSDRLTALRALPPVSGYGSRPGDDVIQLANRVLESAGLPAARLRGVQPEPDRTLTDEKGGSEGRRLATVRLSLEPLTSQELGAFLAAWRSKQQVWSVARIDLSALTPARENGAARNAGNYRAGITVSASYVDDPSSPAKPTPNPGAHP